MDRAAEQYAAAVVEILARHVPGWGDRTAPGDHERIVWELVARQFTDPKDSFEVIVDDLHQANWRLLPSRTDRRRVHLYCYGVHQQPRNAGLEYTVNSLLDGLPLGEEPHDA